MNPAPPTPHVLIVDDDGRIRDLLYEVFAGEGYEVAATADGMQAWEWLRKSPLPLVVILDEVLPGLRGLELLARVASDQQLAHRHGYLLLTATAQHLEKRDLPLPIPIIPKPCDPEILLALVADTAQRLQEEIDLN